MLAVCGRFASFLFAALFFELRPQLVCKVGSIFGPQAGPRKRVPVLLFKTVSQLGEFGAQIWGPDLGPNFGIWIGPPSHAFLVAGLCTRWACNRLNSYALPRGGCAGCGRDICLMDQSNRSNIFSTVFCDVNLAAATVEGLRAEARKAWFFTTPKSGAAVSIKIASGSGLA